MRLASPANAAARNCTAAIGLLLLAPFDSARGQGDSEVLTNATVVQMVTAKLSKDLLVGKIKSARPGFDLSSEGIVSLLGLKVDQSVIRLMLQVADSAKRSGTAPATLVGMDEVLTNEIIVRMVSGKVPKQLILTKIQMSRSAFDVSASGLVGLSTNKVPDDVIKAMVKPPAPARGATGAVREPAAAPAAAATTEAKPGATAPAKGKAAPPAKAPAKKPPAAPKKPG